MLKLGRGEAGAAAAVSHTGSLAGSAAAWSAAFRRAGMAEVEDFDALLETAGLFAKAPPPKARGVAIVTPSGGAGIMAADHAEALGLDMPQPAPETERVLRDAIPDFGAPRNPCDLTAQVATNPAMFDACMDAMLADAQYGVVVMPVVYSHHATTQVRMEGMRPHAQKHGKPLCIAWLPEQLEGPGRGGRGWGAGAAAVPEHAAADERHPPLARPRCGGGDAGARRRAAAVPAGARPRHRGGLPARRRRGADGGGSQGALRPRRPAGGGGAPHHHRRGRRGGRRRARLPRGAEARQPGHRAQDGGRRRQAQPRQRGGGARGLRRDHRLRAPPRAECAASTACWCSAWRAAAWS